ncbi:MAG: acetyl-CoA carboxylase biotin carboxyl carrier protein [Vallitaleaceae bacterium]|nr:acetyl-CoA carboxylase biotin carboxyl carrier protein [Vallitaleaceae bacterium]
MNTNEVLQVIDRLTETGFHHIELNHEGSVIVLSNLMGSSSQATAPVTSAAPTLPLAHTKAATVTKSEETSQEHAAHNHIAQVMSNHTEAVKVAEGIVIESPIVGTFYNSPSPDAEAYVSVGTKVKKGQVLCIIEAMKLMNEIEAEQDGEIAEIFVKNEQGVEYGQPLFRIV